MKILILCTGNSCRSQMAHGFLQSFDGELTVRSAGTKSEIGSPGSILPKYKSKGLPARACPNSDNSVL